MNKNDLDNVVAAIKSRAAAYYYLYKEMETELGAIKAEEIFKKAIYKMGKEKAAKKYSDNAKLNAEILADEFVNADPVHKEIFLKKEVTSEATKTVLEMENCPLVISWKEMGLNDKDVALMCGLASAVDFGTFETLGYELQFISRIADGKSCCQLSLKKME